MLEKVWSKRNLSYMIGGKVNWCSSYGKWYGSASKRLKVELPYDLETPLLGTYPDKTIIWNNTRTSLFTAALFTTARTWKQLKCPATDEWIKKMWYLCPMGYYSFIKKEANNAMCSSMDEPRGDHTKWRNSERKDKYRMISLTCGI